MKKFRKIGFIGCIICMGLIVLMIGSTLIRSWISPDDSMTSIPYMDEEDFSFDTITDEEIVAFSACGQGQFVVTSQTGAQTGVKVRPYNKCDWDQSLFNAKKYNGMRAISASLVKDSTLHLTITTSIEGGKGKIVILRDDTILETLPFGGEVKRTYVVEGSHTFVVKIIVSEAKIETTVLREIAP